MREATTQKQMNEALISLPKVELHLHLDGMITADLIYSCARRRGLPLPDHVDTAQDLIPYMTLSSDSPSLTEFLRLFEFFLPIVRGDAIALRQLTTGAYRYLLDNNIIYAEIRFCPQLFQDQHLSARDIIELVCTTMAECTGRAGPGQSGGDGPQVRFLLCAIRETPEWTRDVIDLAHEYRDKGVVGVDLAGDEQHTCMSHAEEFKRAHDLGLNITVHAGEMGPPEEVRNAIVELHADRIGHGYNCIQSDHVYELVKQSGTHLECCLVSSLQTGAVLHQDQPPQQQQGSAASHPVQEFARDGISFSLSTDDPAMFRSSLNGEYIYAYERFGLDFDQISNSILHAAKAAFLPDSDRRVLCSRIAERIQQIQADLAV